MQEAHREILRKNRTFLVRELEPKLLYDYLVEHGIYNDVMLEDIRAERTRFDQSTKLLTSLTRRGRDAFRVFCQALDDSGQYDIADRLLSRSQEERAEIEARKREEKRQMTRGYTATVSATAVHTSRSGAVQPSGGHEDTPWPAAGDDGIYDVKRLLNRCTTLPSSNPRVYSMTRKPRGHVFILNNKYFAGLPLREGTNKDAENVKKLFQELSFTTETHQNLNTAGIHEKLRNFAQKNHEDSDCCVVVLLSHGGQGGIFGTDSGIISFQDILQKFNGENCPDLIGKPKLFFVQACRGDDRDSGVTSSDSNIPGSTPSDQSTPDATVASPQQVFAPNVPSIADTFLAYGTLPGFVSWRNSDKGSWFICALMEVFLKYAATMDINQLMTEVNYHVSQKIGTSTSYRQLPAPVNMLTKNLYFNPGVSLPSLSDTTDRDEPCIRQESTAARSVLSHDQTVLKSTRGVQPTD
ncbi:PREDICTED: caspase-7-like [Branchiostoma belcheri]|uniref:Caspase-7-like n=1 Tax=Branchiostoma belcheri TaxID=7741 RepID=A0A6P4YXT2_BRABE|nr:PREDICTED: caspase-7-like [Branchiostoma belcheri]